MVQAQIDFSGLDKWRGVDAQRGPDTTPERKTDSPAPAQRRREPTQREPTQKEVQEARERTARLVATIREKLSKPQASVTWTRAAVHVRATGGYFNTPPSPAGVFAVVAAGAAKTPATSISPLALRRAAAILARAVLTDSGSTSTESEETVAFLAGEAATAMQGGDLRVRVDDSAFKWNGRQQEQFRAVLQEAEGSFRDIEFAKSERARIDEEVIRIDHLVLEGVLSADKAESRIKELSSVLAAALKRSKEAQESIRDLPKRIEIIVEQ
jgi:membrane protein implicated in regulation of membrane protease activity